MRGTGLEVDDFRRKAIAELTKRAPLSCMDLLMGNLLSPGWAVGP